MELQPLPLGYEKAFDSIHRDALRKIMRCYGIPCDKNREKWASHVH